MQKGHIRVLWGNPQLMYDIIFSLIIMGYKPFKRGLWKFGQLCKDKPDIRAVSEVFLPIRTGFRALLHISSGLSAFEQYMGRCAMTMSQGSASRFSGSFASYKYDRIKMRWDTYRVIDVVAHSLGIIGIWAVHRTMCHDDQPWLSGTIFRFICLLQMWHNTNVMWHVQGYLHCCTFHGYLYQCLSSTSANVPLRSVARFSGRFASCNIYNQTSI